MKSLILNVLVLVLFITAVSVIRANSARVGNFAEQGIGYFTEDPNDDEEPSDEEDVE